MSCVARLAGRLASSDHYSWRIIILADVALPDRAPRIDNDTAALDAGGFGRRGSRRLFPEGLAPSCLGGAGRGVIRGE